MTATPSLTTDHDAYDRFETEFVERLFQTIHAVLLEQADLELPPASLAEDVTFAVSSLLDGTTEDGNRPVLAFRTGDGARIVWSADGSSLHERVMGMADELIEAELDKAE